MRGTARMRGSQSSTNCPPSSATGLTCQASSLASDRIFTPLRVHGSAKRPELGNVLVNGPTRCGKGLLATSQILTWEGSVIVNDIKGELYEKTAGYRNRLGPVYRFDPTGYGHRYDPTAGKHTEDDLYE